MSLYTSWATVQQDINYMREQIASEKARTADAQRNLDEASKNVDAAQEQIDQARGTVKSEGLSEQALFSQDRTDLEAEMKDNGLYVTKHGEEVSASLDNNLESARKDLEQAQTKLDQARVLNRSQDLEMSMSR